MPYKVEERDGKYLVINSESNEVKAEKETREDAEDLVHVLHELEKKEDD